jgi:hypothetical protein
VLILTFGASSFQDATLPPIPYADRDARDVAEALANLVNRRTKFVARAHPRVLVGHDATAARLVETFGDLAASLREREIGEGGMVIVMIESHALIDERGLFVRVHRSGRCKIRGRGASDSRKTGVLQSSVIEIPLVFKGPRV